jgi:outer membrane protein TolC
MTRNRALLLGLFLCTAPLLWGDAPALEAAQKAAQEAVREAALANSRSLARFKLAGESAALTEQARVFSLLPSPSAGLSAGTSLWGSGSEAALQDRISAGLSFGVSQKIWDGGKNRVLKAINALSAEITRQEALAEYFAVLDAADAAYYGVLEATTALEAAELGLEAAALTLSMAEVRFESGMISYGEYLQALAEKENQETSRNQSKRDLGLCAARLRNLTGLAELPPAGTFDMSVYEGTLQKFAALEDPEMEALYQALRRAGIVQNPGLAQAALRDRQAEQAVSLAARDYLPSLNASLSGGLNYSAAGGLELSGGRFTLSGSIPLDFWLTKNGVDQKKIAREEQALSRRETELAFDLDLQSAILECAAQAGAVLSSRRASQYGQRQYEYTLELYRLSQSSVPALLDSELLRSGRYNQLIKAQYAFLRGLSKLRSLGGYASDQDFWALLTGQGF